MVDFTLTPSQYYAKTPVVNQPDLTNVLYTGNQTTTATGAQLGQAVNLSNTSTTPGLTGYSLPATSYYNYGVNQPATNGTQTLTTALINTAAQNISTALLGPNLGYTGLLPNPASARLGGSGIPPGATSQGLLQPTSGSSNTAFEDDTEDRVIIYDQSGYFIGASPIMAPLEDLGGVLFPYTPTISVGHKASYEMQSLVHTNYVTPMYQHSQVDNISINGQFTANYPAEAEYLIAMMHFFRSVTKMFYGTDSLAGTPPPVLFLDAYGPFTFDHIPVVITGFDYSMPNDVDYISCRIGGKKQRVPTSLSITVNCLPVYSRNRISNQFGLTKFAAGSLIVGYKNGGADSVGGWL
jgi:hypothetical protein